MTDGNPPRSRLRFLLAILIAAVVLAALEGGLRLGGFEHRIRGAPYRFLNPEGAFGQSPDHPVVIQDPDLFWRLRPDVSAAGGQMRTNSLGYRTPEFEVVKPAGTYRILALGDSITFGVEVAETASWPRRLEHKLTARMTGAAAATRVEVLNLGVPGYTSYQGRRVLAEALAWSPDLVIACFGAFNDWVPAVGRTDAGQVEADALEGLRLYQAAAWVAGRGPPGMEIRLEHFSNDPTVSEARRLSLIDTRTFEGARRVPVEAFRDNLTEMAALARQAGASFALLAAPLPASTVVRNPVALEYRAATQAVASTLDCPFADGWERFRAASQPDDELFLDFCHPTPRGHELLAEGLAESVATLVCDTRTDPSSER